MKYILAVVVVILGGLTVATAIGDQEESRDTAPSKEKPVRDQVPDIGSGPDQGSEKTRPGDAAAKKTGEQATSYSERYKVPEDILRNGLEAIIKDVVTGHAREKDKTDLERRLILVMEEEKLGTSFTRGETSRMTIETMLQQMKRFMPKDGMQRTSIEPQMLAGIRQRAEEIALDIRRKEASANSGRQHMGSLMAAIDYDAPKGYEKIRWDVLGGFEFRDHMKLPRNVTELDGKKVAVAGYMITLGEVEDIHEFLLVESGWSCCFGMAPDVNQVIEIRIPKDQDGVEFTTTPIAVMGVMSVGEEVEDGFVISVYRIQADNVVDIE